MRIETQSKVLARRLVRLERQGRYLQALELISPAWRDEQTQPDISGLKPLEAAALLLRFGALVGFQGQVEMLAESQERSKDLLQRAHRIFAEYGDLAGMAEAENGLAASYARTGEFDESEIWLDMALARDLDATDDIRLQSHTMRTFLLMSRRRHEENVSYGKSVESDFRKNGHPYFNGSLYSNIGLSLKDLGRRDEALEYLTLARKFQEQSKNKLYLAIIHNNLALLYKDLGLFDQAYLAAHSATDIYKKLSDKARGASTLETLAQIYIAEGRFDEAMKTIGKSVSMLRKSENQSFLAESIATKAKIQLATGLLADALFTLSEAIEITRRQSGDADARELATEFEMAWNARPSTTGVEVAADQFELVLPPSLAHYEKYRGVWIQNSHLRHFGVTAGSLALVVEEDDPYMLRGEPSAVLDRSTGEVSCGIFDTDFGVICLETDGAEPVLFDEQNVRVLGRIVGICRDERNADGRMVAVPIKAANDASIS